MTATDGLLNAVLVVFALNLIMFFVGFGIADVGGTNPFNYNDNLLSDFNDGNTSSWDVPSDVGGKLPGGESTSVSVDTGVVYTDTFTSIKSWFVDVTGLGYVLGILSGPKIILTAMGAPEALAWAITAFWYTVTLFLLVAFIWGR